MRLRSLSRRVTLFATLTLGVTWLAAVALMSVVVWAEQKELFDQELAQSSQTLLQLLTLTEAHAGPDDPRLIPELDYDPDETILYRLFAADGTILRQSEHAAIAGLPAPDSLAAGQFAEIAGYRIVTTAANAAGHSLQVAAPLAERREALRDSLTGLLLPMIALLPLSWLLISWAARRALAPMQQLRREIAARDGARLDMIDPADWPDDLVRIAGSLNRFMSRLSLALDAERAFATNAAHELRTPVAIALAQVQQMRQGATTSEQVERIDALERALKRMGRLVARLLQLARADAGIGGSDRGHDLVMLTRLVLDDIPHRDDGGRIRIELPDHPVPARIDPDAFAIVLGNLIENALQHAPQATPIGLRLATAAGPGAVLELTNAGPAIPGPMLHSLTERFARHDGSGFGLGLHICAQIVAHAGGELALVSPVPGQKDGFMAQVTLPA